MSEGDLRRTSNNYLGKLRANFVGTEFRIYDNGSNPDDVDYDDDGGVDTSKSSQNKDVPSHSLECLTITIKTASSLSTPE